MFDTASPLLDAIDSAAKRDSGGLSGYSSWITHEDRARYSSAIEACRSGDLSILDIGCGSGELAKWMAVTHSAMVLAMDRSPVAIRNASYSTEALPDLTFLLADMEVLPLADRSISAITSLDGIYLTEKPRQVLSECRRVLKSGGSLIFTAYMSEDPHKGHGCRHPKFWPDVLEASNFDVKRWLDITDGWRSFMVRKHHRRWQRRSEIIQHDGDRALPALSVSAAFLGIGASSRFVDDVQRLEILATAT